MYMEEIVYNACSRHKNLRKWMSYDEFTDLHNYAILGLKIGEVTIDVEGRN